jgi:hypothetical protein
LPPIPVTCSPTRAPPCRSARRTTAARTLEGQALPIEHEASDRDELRTRYLARFPAARQWFDFADFTLFRFTVSRARYVGGFANAHILRADDLRDAARLVP